MLDNKQTLSRLCAEVTSYPQVLKNVRVTDKDAVAGNVAIHKAIVAAEEEMGESGRVLVRASGTEPLIRVMVEAASAEEAKRHATAIADVVTEELGA